jgi:stringent starvation protein B
MNKPLTPDSQGTSTRPYLIRALHDWCTDNGFTPYVAVYVDANVQVPLEYVKNNEIVLNVGFEATTALKLGNEFIEFKARFGGTAREIVVPVDHIVAIYARENGQGMAFPVPTAPGGSAAAVQGAAPTATPLRGLRLASTEAEAVPPPDPPTRPAARPSSRSPTDEPPEPTSPRPSLKRVK